MGSGPRSFVTHGNAVYFLATRYGEGPALWKTDGTSAGTEVVFDPPGADIGTIRLFGRVGPYLLFGVRDALWRTDGTPSGTQPIAAALDWRSYDSSKIGTPRTHLLFSVQGPSGAEPWVSDGTPQGTHQLADLEPGPGSSDPRGFHVIEEPGGGTTTLFFAKTSTRGQELWWTDGTNTALAVDLVRGSGSGAPKVYSSGNVAHHFDAATGDLYVAFRGWTPWQGEELFRLWRKAGQTGFTLVESEEIYRGRLWSSPTVDPHDLQVFGDRVYCSAYTPQTGKEPFSMGFLDGRVRSHDLSPGPSSSAPRLPMPGPSPTRPGEAAIYFQARNRLFVLDGGTATSLVAADCRPLCVADGRVFFSSRVGSSSTRELWSTDGRRAGTRLEASIHTNHYDWQQGPAVLVDPAGDVIVLEVADFGATGVGQEPHVFTRAGGAALLLDIQPRIGATSRPEPACTLSSGEQIYLADEGVTRRLYRSGAPLAWLVGAGTRVTGDFHALDDGTFVCFVLRERSSQGEDGWVLYRYDGPYAQVVHDLAPPTGVVDFGRPGELIPWREKLYFTFTRAGISELWEADPAGGASVVHTFPAGSEPDELTPVGQRLFFVATGATGRELWVWNPPQAPYLVLDIHPSGDANPRDLIAFRNRCYFTADDGTHGRELWRSNGVGSQTVLVLDANPGGGDGVLSGLTSSGNYLFFAGDDGVHGSEPWRSTGFGSGTTMVIDLEPGAAGSEPREIEAVHVDRMACSAFTSTTGRELFLVSGATGQATPFDVRPGPASSEPRHLTWTTRYLLFSADDGVHGREPWFADWIDFGNVGLLEDVEPGPGSSDPEDFSSYGAKAFFSAFTTAYDREPWTTELGSVSFRVGDACPHPDGTLFLRSTAPRIGASFTYWVYQTTPGLSIVRVSAVPGLGTPVIPSSVFGCRSPLDPFSLLTLEQFTTAVSGGYVRTLQIPSDPGLEGALMRMQVFLADQVSNLMATNAIELRFGG